MREPAGTDDEHTPAQGGQVAADGRAQGPHPAQRPERRGDRVDEYRDHRLGRRVAEQLLQGLHGAVIDIHRRGDRDVDVGFENPSRTVGGEIGGNGEGAFVGAVVADPFGRGADAERRHRPVEESVVVVRGEGDHEVGVELGHERASAVDGRLDVIEEFA